jgi:hypothetical protein
MIDDSADFIEVRVDHILLRQMSTVVSALLPTLQSLSSALPLTTNQHDDSSPHPTNGDAMLPLPPNDNSLQRQHDALQVQVFQIAQTVQSISHDVKSFITSNKLTKGSVKSYAAAASATPAPATKEKAFANRWTLSLPQELRDKVKSDGMTTTMAQIRSALTTTAFPSSPPQIEGLAQLRSGDLAIWFATYEDKAKAIAKRTVWIPDWSAAIVPPRNQQKHGVLLSYVSTQHNPDDLLTELQARYPLGYITACRWLTATGSNKAQSTIVVHTMNKSGAETLHSKRVLSIHDQAYKIVDYYKTDNRAAQCFNCQGYGHLSYQCTHDTCCAKCAEAHRTALCKQFPRGEPLPTTSELLHCINCDAHAPSWHADCPKAKLKNFHHSEKESQSEYNSLESQPDEEASNILDNVPLTEITS